MRMEGAILAGGPETGRAIRVTFRRNGVGQMVIAGADGFTIDQSDWREAPVRLDGETVFAIGDVHGCHGQLAALLERLSALAPDPARLVFLGDLICRGPSSLAALALWAAPTLDARFAKVHRLSGNHEQLLMLSIGTDGQAAFDKWTTTDGMTFVDELRRKTGRRDAPLTRDLLLAAAGPTVLDRLDHLQSHVWIGNTILVHGGLDPAADPATHLAAPYSQFGGNHWAWINEPFLKWRGGFNGLMVVHGHTPPAKHRQMSGYSDPHVFQHDRLSLDGGSAVTGIVAAAQIEDGRYRLFMAHGPSRRAGKA
jgi:serine/threonine protein phosphatase 1